MVFDVEHEVLDFWHQFPEVLGLVLGTHDPILVSQLAGLLGTVSVRPFLSGIGWNKNFLEVGPAFLALIHS